MRQKVQGVEEMQKGAGHPRSECGPAVNVAAGQLTSAHGLGKALQWAELVPGRSSGYGGPGELSRETEGPTVRPA